MIYKAFGRAFHSRPPSIAKNKLVKGALHSGCNIPDSAGLRLLCSFSSSSVLASGTVGGHVLHANHVFTVLVCTASQPRFHHSVVHWLGLIFYSWKQLLNHQVRSISAIIASVRSTDSHAHFHSFMPYLHFCHPPHLFQKVPARRAAPFWIPQTLAPLGHK